MPDLNRPKSSRTSRHRNIFFLLPCLLLLYAGLVSAFTPHSVYEDFMARPQFQVYFSKSLLPESSLLLPSNADLILLPGPSGGRWACRIPEAAEEQDEDPVEWRDPEEERKEAEGKLEGLKGGCLYFLQGWFTYEYCQWVFFVDVSWGFGG